MASLITARAIAKGVRITPRKMGEVASLVRGRSVADALVILQHTPRRAAGPMRKVIDSAKANAVNTFGVDEASLLIASLQVTSGPSLRRFKPVAMGRAQPFHKRTSHIIVVVSGDEKAKKPSTRRSAVKAADKPSTTAQPKGDK